MGLFGNLISKKTNTSSEEIVVLPTSETGCLGEAEQMANVVTAGLDAENYSGMNRKLSSMARNETDKEVFVFDHPGVVGTFVEMTICAVATCVYLYFLFISSATAIFSAEYFTLGTAGVGIALAILAVNVCLIVRSISSIRYEIRFNIYSELLGFKSLEFVEDLAICSKQNERTVIKDLQKAAKRKLIPQGHFSRDKLVFMVSDKVYDNYMEKPAVYDRYFQKKIEERRRVKSRTKRISQIMDSGEQYIKKLNDFKTLVKDKVVSKKIERMENVVSMIFHEIDASPSQANSLGVFLNYYLPTTEKLLDAYVSISEKKITVPNLATAKKEIEEALNTIIKSFEGILEKLYEENEMDISSDIAAMELVMKKEGLSG